MNAAEIRTVVNDLDKARDAGSATEVRSLLLQLDSRVHATEALLRETKVGVHVNKLKTFPDKDVVALVKKIIKKWKDQVSVEKKGRSAASAANTSSNKTTAETAIAKKVTADVPPSTLSNNNVTLKPRTPTSDGIKVDIYPDLTRNRSVIALYTAVALDTLVAAKIILDTCVEIETAIFDANRGAIDDAYRTKLRSLILNIKNKNNQQLRANILDGTIPASKLITMSSAELAPESLKQQMKELHAKNLFDAQGAVEKRAVTDRFVCGKCKQREVSYYQMQTRSADEPLTTFCTCEKCGNRWKFC